MMAKQVLEAKFSENKEIKKNVCGLLNTNGGKLVLTASDATADNKIDADKIIRPIEQYFGGIIGPYEVHNGFHVLEEKYNSITLGMQALPLLCTFNTYLYLPTNTEIRQISCMEQDAIRKMLFERRSAEDVKHKVPESFISKCDCGLRESKAVQFKHLKAEKSKTEKSKPKKKTPTDFADRVINNKFTDIISAFANANGGNIFYGINDSGIVEGELLSDAEELAKTTEKLEKAVGKMIWQDESRKVERGREWDIKFVPVKDCNNATIPSTFVMVVTVHPYIGGVFTKEPESYYVEDGEVKKMPFDIWRRNTYYKVATPVEEVGRSSWSSKENRMNYMKITQTLENWRQLGDWKRLKLLANEINQRNNLPVNSKLTCLVQIVALYYRQGDFQNAEKILKEFREDIVNAEDKSVFAVKERYSASAIERSRGNYQEAWKIIEECLILAHNVPAGLIPASVYANAASILSSLVEDESFIDTSKDDKGIKSQVRVLIEMAKSFCHHAMQHLLYIEYHFDIAKEDLRQRINITLASLHLKSADTNISTPVDIERAEQSLKNPKGTERLTYNTCRQLLVTSDIYFQKYRLERKDTRIEHWKKSLKYVQDAQKLADEKCFREIKRLCEKRIQKINVEQTNQDERDEQEQTKKIVDDFFS